MKIINFIFATFFVYFVVICSSHAQSQFMLGGTAYDDASSVFKTSDGYVIAGSTTSYGIGNYDMYIIKLNNSYVFQWSGTVGGTGADRAYSLTQTTDGGFVFAGYTSFPPSSDGDFYIAKYNSIGNFLWSRTLAGSVIHAAMSVSHTSDGGCIATGTTTYLSNNGDCYIVKLDAGGNLQWNKIIGGTGQEISRTIIQTIDGGYVASGSTNSFGVQGNDLYVIKTDANGNLLWSATIGGTNNQVANSVIQTADSGYALVGSTEPAIGNMDMYIVKLDKTGSFQWAKNVGGGSNDIANSIIQNPDGSYVLTGETHSFGVNGPDMYIVKFDVNGIFQWSRVAGGTGTDIGKWIIKTSGGFEIAGFTDSFSSGLGNMYIVMIGDDGTMCGSYSAPTSLTGSGATFTSASSNVTTPTWILTTPPSSVGNAGGNVTTLCNISPIKSVSTEIPNEYKLLQNYPNPFNPKTKISFELPIPSFVSLKVFDVLGNEVAELLNDQLQSGYYETEWDAGNHPSGIYYYNFFSDDFKETKKMILLK
jgi:hypothetical protein